MKTRTKKTRTKKGPQPARSSKAGKPPREGIASRQVRRRQKTARAAVRKDTMLLQAAEGPRVLWGVTKPKVKKR
ncbi:MAG TPA: hypothetical protein VLG10_11735 [Methylomirabilota bacterium]|nr:hypothetical protein [Methylomirabilota bacterium]